MFCATVLYPYSEKSSFDFEKYAGQLAPAFAAALGDNCVKFEVRRGLGAPDSANAAFLCIASYWIKSREEFGAAFSKPEMQKVMGQISTFSQIQPIRQFDEVVV